jgi:hypothetical protein
VSSAVPLAEKSLILARSTDLAAIARGCRFAQSLKVRNDAELTALREQLYGQQGSPLAVVKVAPDALPQVLPRMTPSCPNAYERHCSVLYGLMI